MLFDATVGRRTARATPAQIKALCELMHHAFLEIRLLGYAGHAEQAAACADAFHNLPQQIFTNRFEWDRFEEELASYQKKYATSMEGTFNYTELLKKIEALSAASETGSMPTPSKS